MSTEEEFLDEEEEGEGVVLQWGSDRSVVVTATDLLSNPSGWILNRDTKLCMSAVYFYYKCVGIQTVGLNLVQLFSL